MPTENYKTAAFRILIPAAILVNLSGLFTTIMAPDGTLYASIAKTMVMKNNYIELFALGHDWLDKPHFPFWITAFFFKIFGITTWAYKLPAIIFSLIGAWYTYILADKLYTKTIANWSVLIYLTALHVVLSNFDVRAEPYLTGLIVAAVYHYYISYTNKNNWHILPGALYTAAAIMTKGIFIIIPIGSAIVGELLIKNNWKQLFNIRWVIAVILTGIFILPELYCLYIQFDIHPEKLVFGRHSVSGIRFFFWDSQFGRFFNTGPIKGSGDPLFFFHTILWAFLPWCILLYISVFEHFRKNIKNAKHTEWICICGSLSMLLVFSVSRFQLPHYITIIFPFFAILTARYCCELTDLKIIRTLGSIQNFVITVIFAGLILLTSFFKPAGISYIYADLLLIVIFSVVVFAPFHKSLAFYQPILTKSILAAFALGLYLNFVFYPSLLHYQAESEAAFWINQNNKNKLEVAAFDNINTNALMFYIKQPLFLLNSNKETLSFRKSFILYGETSRINALRNQGSKIEVLKSFDDFWITRLKPKFLNEATRAQTLGSRQLVIISN